VIPGGAAVLLQNDTVTITVANRVIAIGHQSVIGVWRVKAESRRVEASPFYLSTVSKRQAGIFYGLFYGRQDFSLNYKLAALTS